MLTMRRFYVVIQESFLRQEQSFFRGIDTHISQIFLLIPFVIVLLQLFCNSFNLCDSLVFFTLVIDVEFENIDQI